jgi:RNA polymerase sigma-70 factor (ECF subfamily)
MNEPDLITGIKNGDVQCFEELFIKYYSHFNQFIFGLVKDEWISEDITQNTFIIGRNYKAIYRFTLICM